VRTDVSEELISLILVTLMIEALTSSETPFLTRAIRRNIPEDGIFHGGNMFIETSVGTGATQHKVPEDACN
jgi:hypothetical protein